MSKTFYCSFCDIELNEENSCPYGFLPCCKVCEKKKSTRDFKHHIGKILNNIKGLDIGYYSDKDNEKIIIIYKQQSFSLKVERRD